LQIADIIYHLFDAFTAYNQEIVEAKRKDAAPQAVWPCRLKIIAAFAKRDPIILGVDILDGTLRVGTPLAVVKVDKETGKKEIHELGKITSLEINHKTFDVSFYNSALISWRFADAFFSFCRLSRRTKQAVVLL
jgi:translation initiation factor 5B